MSDFSPSARFGIAPLTAQSPLWPNNIPPRLDKSTAGGGRASAPPITGSASAGSEQSGFVHKLSASRDSGAVGRVARARCTSKVPGTASGPNGRIARLKYSASQRCECYTGQRSKELDVLKSLTANAKRRLAG